MTQQPFLRVFVTPAALCAFGFAVAMIAVLQYSVRAYIPGSLEAGGFTPRASGDVVITRLEGSFEGGAKTLRLRLGGGPLSPKDQISLELVLQNGDIITASAKYYVTVEGEVAHPSRYPIDGDLTVTGAISLAGGLSRFGGNGVKVRRVDPETGKTTILEVDLKAVRSGKAEDPPLLANDVITVPRRKF